MKSKCWLYKILILTIVGVIFISGCVQQPKQEPVTCDSPYIKVGTSCCLDQNSNNFCDKDEVGIDKQQESLSDCLEKNVKCTTDSECINKAYLYCGDLLKENCKFKGTGIICDEEETIIPEMQVIKPKTCTKGYTDDYVCSSTYSLKKYQKEDCSYEWVNWYICGIFPCKIEGGKPSCDYTNPDPAFATVDFCTLSELKNLEDNGLWTGRSISYEFSDIISERAKVDTPLLIQGGLGASYGKDKHKLIDGICFVGNAPINIKIYKGDLELFFDSVMTNQYGDWESEKFIPKEIGYYKLVISWLNGNMDSEEEAWRSIEVAFHVSE